MLSDQGQAGQDLSDRGAVARGVDADGHGLAVVLDDEVARDAGADECGVHGPQVFLVARVERDRDAPGLRAWQGTLTGRVRDLGALLTVGDVRPHDDVVYEWRLDQSGRRGLENPWGLSVNGS